MKMNIDISNLIDGQMVDDALTAHLERTGKEPVIVYVPMPDVIYHGVRVIFSQNGPLATRGEDGPMEYHLPKEKKLNLVKPPTKD